jgi:uncharacterized protein involved in cysteine biosynthesis
VQLTSPASAEAIAALHAAVERSCPILNLLLTPQQISGSIVHTPSQEIVPEEASV